MNRAGAGAGPQRVQPGQRRTSNIGGPTLVVLETTTGRDGEWLVRFEDSGVMTTIDESELLDNYDLAANAGA